MEDEQRRKTATLYACVAIMIMSGLVLLNQIRLNNNIKNIEEGLTKSVEINWADGGSTVGGAEGQIDYKQNMRENLTDAEGFASQSNRQSEVGAENSARVNNGGEASYDYVVNVNSKKIHSPDCASALKMSEKNKRFISQSQFDEYINNGYTVCSVCGAEG